MNARLEIPTLSIAELEADPYGVYRKHRPVTPFIHVEGEGFLVLRAEDVRQLIRDPRLRNCETDWIKMFGHTEGTMYDLFDNGMIFSNGATHRRRRAPFSRTFAVGFLEKLRPFVRSVTDELVESWIDDGEVDLMPRFATHVPARVMCKILGLPAEDIPYFSAIGTQASQIASAVAPEKMPEIQTATRELVDYVTELLKRRRDLPESDFLSQCVANIDEGEGLSPIEMVMQLVILIIAGSETTRVAIGALMALLLENRDQWEAICKDQSLIPAAVSEGLRYETSSASVGRISLEEIAIDGYVLPAGQVVHLSLMSALRDERSFDQPDVFNIYREIPRVHLVFGGGVHRCLGEALAWTELEEGLASMVTRIPQMRLAEAPPRLRGHLGVRFLDHLHITWK